MNAQMHTLTPEERAHRQTAMDHAIASNRLEGLILPPEGHAILQNYVDGKITFEEEQAQMQALAKAILSGDVTINAQDYA